MCCNCPLPFSVRVRYHKLLPVYLCHIAYFELQQVVCVLVDLVHKFARNLFWCGLKLWQQEVIGRYQIRVIWLPFQPPQLFSCQKLLTVKKRPSTHFEFGDNCSNMGEGQALVWTDSQNPRWQLSTNRTNLPEKPRHGLLAK